MTSLARTALAVKDDLHTLARIEGLFAYGIFNPLGPTVCAITKLRFKNYAPDILHFRMLNPFQQGAWVFGVVKSDAPPEAAESVLKEAFEKGKLGEVVLVGGLPSWIVAPTKERLKIAERCFSAHVTVHSRLDEVRRNLAGLRAYAAKPWDRLLAEQRKVEPPSAQDGTFAEWFSRITSEEHLGPETYATFIGWDGAIDFVRAAPETVFRTKRAVDYLEDCGFDLRRRWQAGREGEQ